SPWRAAAKSAASRSRATVLAGNRPRSPGSGCCHVWPVEKSCTLAVAEHRGGVRAGERGLVMTDVRVAADSAARSALSDALGNLRYRLGLRGRMRGGQTLQAAAEDQVQGVALGAAHNL